MWRRVQYWFWTATARVSGGVTWRLSDLFGTITDHGWNLYYHARRQAAPSPLSQEVKSIYDADFMRRATRDSVKMWDCLKDMTITKAAAKGDRLNFPQIESIRVHTEKYG